MRCASGLSRTGLFLFCQRPPTPIDIEPLRRGVELDPRAGCRGGIQDRRTSTRYGSRFNSAGQSDARACDERIFVALMILLGHLRFAQMKTE